MTDIHIVQVGETMVEIATVHNITLKDLLKLNPHIDNPDLIFAGQQLNVPGNGESRRDLGKDKLDGVPRWFEIARRELGVSEIAGDEHNPRIIEYHSTTTYRARADEVPWCSSFVNWCVEQSGVAGTDSAAARSWSRWGKSLTQPRRGCIAVFSSSRGPHSGHVGFFERVEGNHVLVLGGNQSDAVNYSSYSKSRLLGYRWPN
jgi:uncharacterized protein (TIGR02594 family)